MKSILIGVLSALATGLAIGTQSTLSSRTGDLIGPFRTGLFMNLVAGVLSALIIFFLFVSQNFYAWRMPTKAVVMILVAGSMGILINTGVSFSLSRVGITAGLATIILGQLFISVLVDLNGWGGVEPIPFDWRRMVGLAVMGLAVYLLLPQK